MKITIILAGLLLAVLSSDAQTNQVKSVMSNGGNIKKGGTFESFSVVGQLANSEYSKGFVSGTIGYLDFNDNFTSGILISSTDKLNVKIYPNPSSGDVYIEPDKSLKGFLSIRVLNITGVVLSDQLYNLVSIPTILDRTIFPTSGLYIIHVSHDSSSHTEKLSILR